MAHHEGSHHAAAAHHEEHAGPKLYVIFALILCAITFLEWLIFKERHSWGLSNTVMVVSLLVLSLIKFIMVCGWYMHLRYDHRFLTKMFVSSAAMAIGVFIVVAVCLH